SNPATPTDVTRVGRPSPVHKTGRAARLDSSNAASAQRDGAHPSRTSMITPQGSTPVKSTVETLSPTRVRLEIEVPFVELEPNLKKAYRDIGSQVTIPGFRKGKVPAAVIDQRVGRQTILTEAIQDAIPENFVAAVREHEVRTLGRPEVEITE